MRMILVVAMVGAMLGPAGAGVRDKPHPEDALLAPERIAGGDLLRVFFDGEPVNDPLYPLIAVYGFENVRSGHDVERAKLQCWRGDDAATCDGKVLKRGDVRVCVEDDDASWNDRGFNCTLKVATVPGAVAGRHAMDVIAWMRSWLDGKATQEERAAHAAQIAKVHAATVESWKRSRRR